MTGAPASLRASQLDWKAVARAVPSGLALAAAPQILGEPWRMAPHLELLTQKLVDLEQRRIRRLIVEMPPRHGKSQLCSVFFPAWYLGRHPGHRVMIASEEIALAAEFSQKSRTVLEQFGPPVFGVRPHLRRTRATHWVMDGHAGQMMAAGIKTGGLTGRGANLLIVDDPIKNVEGAMSETYRQRVWDWFVSTARSRLEPGGVMIVIMTRWHEDDLVGRILKGSFHTEWTRVRLPALAEADDPLGRAEGDPLWPWRMNKTELLDIATTSEYWWNAMYQQRPRPPGGAILKADWFPAVGAVPEGMTKVRFWDIASTEGSRRADPDWTVGALVSRDVKSHTFFLEHIVRVRYSPADVQALILGMAKQDGRRVIIREEQEPGASGKAVIAARTALLAGYDYAGVPSTGEKETRWMPFRVQAEARNFRVLDPGQLAGLPGLPWVRAFLDEALAAPYGTHDDQVDAVAGAFNTLTLHEPSAIPGLVW